MGGGGGGCWGGFGEGCCPVGGCPRSRWAEPLRARTAAARRGRTPRRHADRRLGPGSGLAWAQRTTASNPPETQAVVGILEPAATPIALSLKVLLAFASSSSRRVWSRRSTRAEGGGGGTMGGAENRVAPSCAWASHLVVVAGFSPHTSSDAMQTEASTKIHFSKSTGV